MITEYIIHADDFGHSAMVNRAIDECFMRDWLSETSLMVNMPGCEEAVALATSHGYMDYVGIHVNLTEGHPLTDMILECPRFCSPDGLFTMDYRRCVLGRFVLSRKEEGAVRVELEAQLKRFLDIGGRMMRIDSHHHVHTDWSIYRILKPLAVKFGFMSMRLSADLHATNGWNKLYKAFFNANVRNAFQTTAHFDGNCAELLAGPGGSTEVMVHPLLHESVLCDSRRNFAELINAIRSVEKSEIRSWRNV